MISLNIKWSINACISLFYILFYSTILSIYSSNPFEISCFAFTLLSKCSLAYSYTLKKKDSPFLKRKRIKICLSLIQSFVILYTSILIYTKIAITSIQLSWIEIILYFVLQSMSTMTDVVCLITLIDGEEWNINYISQV